MGVPILAGVGIYISIYDLSPRTDYYDDFETLNQELGWDNLGAVLLLPQGVTNVTEPDAVREMYAMEERLLRLPFVEGTVSLARLVMIANQIATGRHEFPPEGRAGDQQINTTIDILTTTLADQVYGQVLAPDHKSALLVVIMTKGATGPEYREWQEELKEVGLAIDGANPYAGALTATPLSIDIIYSTLDDVAVTEGPLWVGFTLLVCVAFVMYLFRRPTNVLAALGSLLFVMTVSLAAATLLGIEFNLLSILVIAFVFAMGIDYAMHVISRYREERAIGMSVEDATATAMVHTGRALFMTSITTTLGFATLYFSRIPAIGTFGIIVGASIFTAYLSSVLLLPALLAWRDKGKDAGPRRTYSPHVQAGIDEARDRKEARVRERQENGILGRMTAWTVVHRKGMTVATLALIALAAVPLASTGVPTWGASYLDPHPIFREDEYSMVALRAMDATFGIPNELAIMVYGDATDPDVLRYLAKLHEASTGVHGRTRTDSIVSVFQLDRLLNPQTRFADDDGDGLPDRRQDIEAAYARMARDPAMNLVFTRVMLEDHGTSAVRLAINPNPSDSVGRDVDNYRESRRDVESILALQSSHAGAAKTRSEPTGLVMLATEVVDAIIRGNTASVLIMLGVVYVVLLAFWRRIVPAAIAMIPVVLAVLVQYGFGAYLGYEVNYVSLILTGLVMGLGVDDSVHLISRVREEVARGRSAAQAVVVANAEVGRVLIATTVTTLSPFIMLLGSVVTWARQTAILTIPTLLTALLATIVLVPPVLAWHAERFPASYGGQRQHDGQPEARDNAHPIPGAVRGR